MNLAKIAQNSINHSLCGAIGDHPKRTLKKVTLVSMRFFLRFNEAIYALEIDKWFCCTVILLPLQLLIQRKHVLSCVNSPSHHHPFTPYST